MKIVALTDVHGTYKKSEEIIRVESPDFLVIGGDLTTAGTVKEAEQALGCFMKLSPRLLAVAGNMDLPQHEDLYLKLGVALNARGIIVGDIGFFGVSSAPFSPLHTPYEISEEEISRRITVGYKDIGRASKKILISHAPPYGTKVDIAHSGIHVGSTAVRDFIEEYQPDVVVCGHIHEGRGVDTIEKSVIVNPGSAAYGYYAVLTPTGDRIDVKNLQYFTP